MTTAESAPGGQGEGGDKDSAKACEKSPSVRPAREDDGAVSTTPASSVHTSADTGGTRSSPPDEPCYSAIGSARGNEGDPNSVKETATDKSALVTRELASSNLKDCPCVLTTLRTRKQSLEPLPEVESDAAAYRKLLLSYFPAERWYSPPPSLSPFLLARAGFKCIDAGVIECPLCGVRWKWRQMVQYSQTQTHGGKRLRLAGDETNSADKPSQLRKKEKTSQLPTTGESTSLASEDVTKERSSSSSSRRFVETSGGKDCEKDSLNATGKENNEEEEEQVGDGLKDAVALSFLHADYCPRKGTFIPLSDVGLSGPSVMPLTLIENWERRYQGLRIHFSPGGGGLPLISLRSAIGYLSDLIFSQSRSIEALAHLRASAATGGAKGDEAACDFPVHELLWPCERSKEKTGVSDGATGRTAGKDSSRTAKDLDGKISTSQEHQSTGHSARGTDQSSPYSHSSDPSEDSCSRVKTLMYLLLLLLHPSFAPESVETNTFRTLNSIEAGESMAKKGETESILSAGEGEDVAGKEGGITSPALRKRNEQQDEGSAQVGGENPPVSQTNCSSCVRELVSQVRKFADAASCPSSTTRTLSLRNVLELVPVDPLRILALFGWEAVLCGDEVEKKERVKGSPSSPGDTVLQCTYCLREVGLKKLFHFTFEAGKALSSRGKKQAELPPSGSPETDSGEKENSASSLIGAKLWSDVCYKYVHYYCDKVYGHVNAMHDVVRGDDVQTTKPSSSDTEGTEFICGYFMPAPGVAETGIFSAVHSHRLHCPYISDAVYRHPCVLEELIMALLPSRLKALERAAVEEQLNEDAKRAWKRRTAKGLLMDDV
ncbi:c3hc zinc finger-like protein [Cystoisospora suis]|uniref:C3hc zinc finger-like protein n=1 Tax=Cystoisospora suis TaxID=483139 RepID=A0A2C6LCI1_9APIC|nr:c3hc zinc finger-like protein [Cystoisospora suis]